MDAAEGGGEGLGGFLQISSSKYIWEFHLLNALVICRRFIYGPLQSSWWFLERNRKKKGHLDSFLLTASCVCVQVCTCVFAIAASMVDSLRLYFRALFTLPFFLFVNPHAVGTAPSVRCSTRLLVLQSCTYFNEAG